MSYNPGGLTDTQIRATPLPVSGTVTASISGTVTVTGGLTDTQLRASAVPVSIATMPSTPVTGTFWQATQPISAASLPLPTGAATSAKQPALGTAGTASTDVITVQGIASGVAQPVSGTFWQATQPISGTVTVGNASIAVTGTFYQATQPISAVSLPLPTGAALDASVTGLSAKFGALGQGLMAASAPVVIASNQSAIPVTLTSTTITGSVAVTGTFWQATQPVSLASTTVTGSVAVTGPLTDTQLRASAVPVSLASTTVTGSVAVTGPLTDTQLRAAVVPVSLASTAITGTVSATQSGTWNVGSITTLPALVAGAAIIGKVGIDQTTPGTTNLVQIGGTLPAYAATPTFNIGTAPTITVTGGLTDTQLRASAVTVSLASTTITGNVAITAASLPLPALAATSTIQTDGTQKARITNGTVDAGIEPFGALQINNGFQTLFYDEWATATIDTTDKWAITGTAPVISGGNMVMPAALSAYNAIRSKDTVHPNVGFSLVRNGIALETAVATGAGRFWGLGTPALNPTASSLVQDGIGYEIDQATGALLAVTYAAGVRTSVATLTRPTDGLNAAYGLYFRVTQAYWVQAGVTVASQSFPNVMVAGLPALIVRQNGAAFTGTPVFSNIAHLTADTSRQGTNIADPVVGTRIARVAADGTLRVSGTPGGTPIPVFTTGQIDRASSIEDLLSAILIEMRVNNSMLQIGLSIRDEPADLREDFARTIN